MTAKKNPETKEEIIQSFDLYIKAVSGKKAEDIVAIDVRGLSSVADVLVICSAQSHRQVIAIADFIERHMKKSGIKPISVEGKNEGMWVLLDYGDIIIHVFYETVRKFYDLEGMWSDAKRIAIDELKIYPKTSSFVIPAEA